MTKAKSSSGGKAKYTQAGIDIINSYMDDYKDASAADRFSAYIHITFAVLNSGDDDLVHLWHEDGEVVA